MTTDYSVKNISLIFVLSLSVHAGLFGASRPEWVLRHPLDAGYFIGVGASAKKSGDADNGARKQALADIASQISTTVSSDDRGTIASSGATIEGSEEIGRWENRDSLWLCIRLSKESFRARAKEQENSAQNSHIAMAATRAHLAQADKARGAGDITLAIKELIAADLSYMPVAGVVMSLGEEDCAIRINRVMNEILGALSISAPDPYFAGPREKASAEPAKIIVTCNGKPVNSLPICFTVSAGKASPIAATTDASGRAACRFDGLPSGMSVRISAAPDLSVLAADRAASSASISRFSVPRCNLQFVLDNDRVICIVCEATADGAPAPTAPVVQKLSDLMIGQGFTCVKTPADARYLCKIEGNATSTPGMEGFYFASLIASVSLTDVSGKKVYGARSVGPIKGSGMGAAAAGKKVWERFAPDSVANAVGKMIGEIK
ncbi:MAG: LPP20 family lipoprotein [Chitinispirillaceae bacterium]|nr:LPP20 family lipoprotein [Chitinispirillaceae bacterium]